MEKWIFEKLLLKAFNWKTLFIHVAMKLYFWEVTIFEIIAKFRYFFRRNYLWAFLSFEWSMEFYFLLLYLQLFNNSLVLYLYSRQLDITLFSTGPVVLNGGGWRGQTPYSAGIKENEKETIYYYLPPPPQNFGTFRRFWVNMYCLVQIRNHNLWQLTCVP